MINKKIKTTIILSFLALIGAGFLIVPSHSQNISPYYSGEAIKFQDTIYVGTTNSGSFELFALEEGELYKKVEMVSPEGEDMPFSDLAFSEEGNDLYVYLVNGRYFYKYNLDMPTAPTLARKSKDNSWYWYNGVKKKGDKVITLGNKGVRIHRKDGTVINSYDVVNNISENVTFSQNQGFIFNVNKDVLEIFDTQNRAKISQTKIKHVNESQDIHNREIYNDDRNSLIYLVDGSFVRAINFQGETVKKFGHTSTEGYDVIPSSNSEYIYFSDGRGVVKSHKKDLSPQDWKYTTDVAQSSGWAMDIDRVGKGQEEKVVVFNHSSILILDSDMEVVASIEAQKDNYQPIESLYLNVDKNKAAPNSKILLSGGGFGLYEDLNIDFAGKNIEAKADDKGRFSKVIEVPAVSPTRTDITVTGEITGRNYSLGFRIE